ncbi:MAG: hypothetical protein ABS95_00920 [Verrucomicrobia bacterium SCN 57-15]|nr:MAG: hypothetical protein ABS95_00920 [Verrucomicrobia bacterium SCN 57-15]
MRQHRLFMRPPLRSLWQHRQSCISLEWCITADMDTTRTITRRRPIFHSALAITVGGADIRTEAMGADDILAAATEDGGTD